jgi:phosphatidylglycerophosphatase A
VKAPPLPSGILRHPVHSLSLGFGLGAAPWAPGTFGTLLGIPCWWMIKDLPLVAYVGVVLLMFAAGVWACQFTARALGVHDHPAIVFDEVVGFLVAMIAAPAGWLWVLAGFALFRLFDIWKPWPIRWLDRCVHGGLGIMLDDAVAGLYALLTLQLAARALGAWG